MKRLICALTIFFSTGHCQQTGPLRFASIELYKTTLALVGDSTAWTVLVAVAERDVAGNGFILPSAVVRSIREFGIIHSGYRKDKLYLTRLLKAGARVFASQKLGEADTLSRAYDDEIRDGKIGNAKQFASRYHESLFDIEQLIVKNRNENIDAILNQKSGSVDKRKGLLSDWRDANKGDLFSEADGLRTGVQSYAQLSFTDGVDVLVDPVTMVVIRASKADKLEKTVRRDIALIKGSLLTKLTANAKQINILTFKAGTAESIVKSGKFWAAANDQKDMKLSNYDGTVDLTANNVKITVGSNQGTIVEKGKAPLPPVNLLQPPSLLWLKVDTVVYTSDMVLRWNAIPLTMQYQIEISPSKEMNRSIRQMKTHTSSFHLMELPLGITYVRLQSIDKNGLRGNDSPVYTIVRNVDTMPPPIYIDSWETDRKYTTLSSLVITGTTEADAVLIIDGKRTQLSPDGKFSFTVQVTTEDRQFRFAATDRAGNTRARILSVVLMDTLRVGKITWDCPVSGSTLIPAGTELSASGTAYPRVRVTVAHAGQTMTILTDSQGRWAVSLKAQNNTLLVITFKSLDDKKIILSKNYQVQ
jgi:hypothetical protein